MWTITTNGNITGSDTWCGFQLPLYFHLLFDICSVGFLISEVIVVCGCCCGHYLFDTLNTDRTRAGADPITSSFFQITFFQVKDTTDVDFWFNNKANCLNFSSPENNMMLCFILKLSGMAFVFWNFIPCKIFVVHLFPAKQDFGVSCPDMFCSYYGDLERHVLWRRIPDRCNDFNHD